MNTACLNCNDFLKGRIDKKFCGDSCRNCYNNKIKTSTSPYERRVNSKLRKNRRILEELISHQTSIVSKNKLLLKGFDFGYHTNIYKTKKGVNSIFCYEYGHTRLLNGKYELLKREEEK